MTLSTLKLGGTEYVVLRKKDYQQLERRAKQTDQQASRPARRNRLSAQDRGDVAESRRRMKEPGGNMLKDISRKAYRDL